MRSKIMPVAENGILQSAQPSFALNARMLAQLAIGSEDKFPCRDFSRIHCSCLTRACAIKGGTRLSRQFEGLRMSNSSDTHLPKSDELIKFASDIVAAYVSNNPTPISEIPGMIKSI